MLNSTPAYQKIWRHPACVTTSFSRTLRRSAATAMHDTPAKWFFNCAVLIRGCIQWKWELSYSRSAWKDTGGWFEAIDSFYIISADWPIGFTLSMMSLNIVGSDLVPQPQTNVELDFSLWCVVWNIFAHTHFKLKGSCSCPSSDTIVCCLASCEIGVITCHSLARSGETEPRVHVRLLSWRFTLCWLQCYVI